MVDDAVLLGVLEVADGPVGVSEIRTALGVPEEVSPGAFRRVLTDAMGRGLVTRTGQKRGTRYTAR